MFFATDMLSDAVRYRKLLHLNQIFTLYCLFVDGGDADSLLTSTARGVLVVLLSLSLTFGFLLLSSCIQQCGHDVKPRDVLLWFRCTKHKRGQFHRADLVSGPRCSKQVKVSVCVCVRVCVAGGRRNDMSNSRTSRRDRPIEFAQAQSHGFFPNCPQTMLYIESQPDIGIPSSMPSAGRDDDRRHGRFYPRGYQHSSSEEYVVVLVAAQNQQE